MGPGPNSSMPSSTAGGGTFATVKASAPNTIQYLPSRPPNSQAGPRGPPSLDFLQRFANPGMMSNGPGGPMNGLMSMNGPMMGPGGPRMGPGPGGMMGGPMGGPGMMGSRGPGGMMGPGAPNGPGMDPRM